MVSSLLALTPALPSELLDYILTHHTYNTTVLICQPRAAFLTSLIRCVTPFAPTPSGPTSDRPVGHAERLGQKVAASDTHADGERSDVESDIGGHMGEAGKKHSKAELVQPHLLKPTLHQIATSRHVYLVYIPSVSHLRAYLAIYRSKETRPPHATTNKYTEQGYQSPQMFVYGLVEIHRHTSEWSAQGLGISLAALVDAGHRSGSQIVTLEELEWGLDGEGERSAFARKLWEDQMPILNGSVKRAGMESDEGAWSGRTVEVGRVLSRWFVFDRGEWDHG